VCDGDGHTIHLYAWFAGRGTGSFDLTGGAVAGAHPDRLTGAVQSGAVVGRFTDAPARRSAFGPGLPLGARACFALMGSWAASA